MFLPGPQEINSPQQPTWHTGEGAHWGCPLVTQQFLENAKSEAGTHKSADASSPKEEEADWLQTLSAPIQGAEGVWPRQPSPTCHTATTTTVTRRLWFCDGCQGGARTPL